MISPGASLSAVAIVGPTAVGKSDVADRLAARLSSEVLSCDAMQIYRGMDIGTAKMAPEECTAPLRLVDIVEPGVAYSAALYQADARVHVERLLGEGLPGSVWKPDRPPLTTVKAGAAGASSLRARFPWTISVAFIMFSSRVFC